MKEQIEGIKSTEGQPQEGILGCDTVALEMLVNSTDIAAIAQNRRQAQARLRELIDKDAAQDHG